MTDWNFITVYFVTREYGGPEEGGWWFDRFDKQHSYEVRHLSAEVVDTLYAALEGYYAELQEGQPGLSSVASAGQFEVLWEEEEGQYHTTHRPHYE